MRQRPWRVIPWRERRVWPDWRAQPERFGWSSLAATPPALLTLRVMESKWLEDFVALARTRSFSRAAEQRHVSQPAFSRRIRALEAWLGADLIDRTSYPTRLTDAGEVFRAQALEMLASVEATRALVRGQRPAAAGEIDIAAPHTLSLAWFPRWLTAIERDFGAIRSRLHAANVHDAVMRLVEGSCDLLLCYHHPQFPAQLDEQRYDMLVLGHDRLAPYARCGRDGVPEFALPGAPDAPLPYLAYGQSAYLGSGTRGRYDRGECDSAPLPGKASRDRHGRRTQDDGARWPWHRIPARERRGRGGTCAPTGQRRRALERAAGDPAVSGATGNRPGDTPRSA